MLTASFFFYLVTKSAMMIKYLMPFIFSQLIATFVFAQDIKKIENDFEKILKDPKREFAYYPDIFSNIPFESFSLLLLACKA